MSAFTDALNAQIGHEFAASQQYIAIAVYYDSETLPQLAAWRSAFLSFGVKPRQARSSVEALVRRVDAGLPRIDGAAGFVFTTMGGSPASGFPKAKKRLDAAVSPPLAPWVTHDLRRTLASGLARLGVQIEFVQKQFEKRMPSVAMRSRLGVLLMRLP